MESPEYLWVEPLELYLLQKEIVYYSRRYEKTITIPVDTYSDGASGAVDIHSNSWWIHDELCRDKQWDDGTPCSNYQASRVLADVLHHEGRIVRRWPWAIATFLFRKYFVGAK